MAPYYDGAPYALIFEGLLRGLHQRVAAWVPQDASCLDACCGTGGLCFELAPRCSRVLGVDISPKMIAHAERTAGRLGLDQVRFRVADAGQLSELPDRAFDAATACMGLHEMPAELRPRVLRELLRVAARVVIADFAAPQPRNLPGLRNRFFEVAAGRRHFAGYRDYQRRGGLPALIERCGARIERQRPLDGATLLQLEVGRG